ncbi:MAG: hypothetical protein KDA96_12700 [Planctomycetaceae bacterium]|nr:hypothetical protein [Planctomycetaceae bacterium]
MKHPAIVTLCTCALVTIIAADIATAGVIGLWNFNSTVPDGLTSTGTLDAAVGIGTASLVGTVSGAFSNGAADGGSTDPAATDNSGWQTNSYPAQSTGSRTHGLQFLVDTTGFESIQLTWDQRNSNTASRYWAVDYSVNGTDWITLPGNFALTSGGAWFNGNLADLSSISAVNDNAAFGVRILSVFEPLTSDYAATGSGFGYGTGGTARFDMVTIRGNPVGAAATVPEPAGGIAILLIALTVMWTRGLTAGSRQTARSGRDHIPVCQEPKTGLAIQATKRPVKRSQQIVTLSASQ